MREEQDMRQKIDLLNGPVFPSLAKLAVPIMATSLVQMAYNLTDMIWIGRIGSNAVASVGAAGMYMWFANGIAVLAKMGGQVKVGHALGAGEPEQARGYARNAIQLSLFFGLFYGIICLLFQGPLIGFFRLNSKTVIQDAEVYLAITCGLVIFSFLNQVFTGILTAMGNSRTSFLATAIGLVINIILDPILIFGIGPFPQMYVAGAAIATVFAQSVVTAVFLVSIRREPDIFMNLHFFTCLQTDILKELIQIGLPFFYSEYDVYRDFHGNRSRGCPKGRFPDRVHLLDDVRWFCRSGQFFYCAEFRSRKRNQSKTGLPLFHDRCPAVGLFLHHRTDRISGTDLPDFHTRSRRSPDGHRLPAYPRRFPAFHVHGNHNGRSIFRAWTHPSSIHCQHLSHRCPDSDGPASDLHPAWTKRYLVEYHNLEYMQRHCPDCRFQKDDIPGNKSEYTFLKGNELRSLVRPG